MKFNSIKLQEDLKSKRTIRGLNLNDSAQQVGITKHQYIRAEKYGAMNIEVFTKLVEWLDKRPDNYFLSSSILMFSHEEYMDIKRGIYIAMKTLDHQKIDQKLCDRIECIHNKIVGS